MPPTAAPPVPGPESALLQRLRDLLAADRPDFDAARQLVATIDPADVALRDRADRLLRVDAALKSATAPAAGAPAPSSPWRRLLEMVPANWRPLAVAAAGAVVAPLTYWNWPATTNPYGPVAAAEAFPLPVPLFGPDEHARTVTFQHGRLLGLHVLPVPADFRLDDEFATWDRRGLFHSAWAVPYADQCFVDGGLWMDDRYLYAGARVGDPWPLRSQSRPGATRDGGWEGGSIQLRLATAGWPVEDTQPTEKFFHLTLWHYAPEGKAYLHLARGKQLELPAGPPLPSGDTSQVGFAAKFLPCPEGYVMKCRIPWALLGLDRAPWNQQLGLCWDVCWSNPTGEHFVGKLTDFFDPLRLRQLSVPGSEMDLLPGKQSYRFPTFWGYAILPPRPESPAR